MITNNGIVLLSALSMFTIALMMLREEKKYVFAKSADGQICLAVIDAVRTILLIALVFTAVILPTQF